MFRAQQECFHMHLSEDHMDTVDGKRSGKLKEETEGSGSARIRNESRIRIQ